MATFIGGVTDQFPQQVLFQPDYNFLSMVQGTKQAQYDRSLSSIRSMHNSLFNARLTNAENGEERDRIFKQIETQLKTLPSLDLSKAQNIQTAQRVFDPITNDQEIIKDMSETQAAQRELQIAERYRLSEKAEERALYNPTSIQDIQNNMMNLAEARRGDGSIMKISSRKYVPFMDVNKYLDDLQKSEGLKMTTNYRDGEGYIVELVNGDGAVQPYTQWAKARLNNPQIREYFGVMGRVNAENQIRGLSYQTGMSKDQVREILAGGIREQMIDQKTEEGLVYQKQLRDIEFALGQYKKAYPSGNIPVSEKQTFESIIAAKESYTTALNGVEQEVMEMSQGDLSHVASNLESIYADQASTQAAYGWASTYAQATAQKNLKTDDVLLKRWDLDFRYKELGQNRELAYMREDGLNKRHNSRMKFDFELEQLKKLDLNFYGIEMGYSTSKQTDTAADVLMSTMNTTYKETYTKAFSYDGSFRSIVGNDKYNKLSPTISKLRDISNGNQLQLTDQDIENIIEIGTELGVEVVNPTNATDARTMMNNLFSGVYKRAEELMTKDPTEQSAATNEQLAKVNGELFAGMSLMDQQNKALTATGLAVSEYITTNREGFENVPELFRSDGRSVYDLSKLTPEQKAEISKIVPQEYKNMSMVSGMTYSYSGIKDYEIETMMSPNVLRNISLDGKNITKDYSKGDVDKFVQALTSVRGENLTKLFGEGMIATYEPSSKQVIFDLKIDPSSQLAKSLETLTGQTGQLKIGVPYETVVQTPGLSRFAANVVANTPQYRKLGITESLLENFNEALQLPSRYANAGITGTVKGDIDSNDNPILILEGQYKHNGTITPISKRFPINGDTRTELINAEVAIEQFLQTIYGRTAEEQRAKAKQPTETFKVNY